MIGPEDVTVCLVTRGNLDLTPVLDSWAEWPNVFTWDNSVHPNRYVYGRYEAAKLAGTPVVIYQDDDIVLTAEQQQALLDAYRPGTLVCNQRDGHQPPRFAELSFVAWGAIADRDLAERAHQRWFDAGHPSESLGFLLPGCDIVFNLLTPTVTVDLGQNHREEAFGEDRLYRDSRYLRWKAYYYDEAIRLRDA